MAKKTLAAFLGYCLLFSVLFVLLYHLYLDERRVVVEPVFEQAGDGVAVRPNKATHVPNAVEQRQVLGLYEDSQSSRRDSPLAQR